MVSSSAFTHSPSKLVAVQEEVPVMDCASRTLHCASRSTSAGSYSSNGHSTGLESATPCEVRSPELGVCEARDWEPVFVRNTFLDAPPAISQSLVGFFQEREIHSCPASGLGLTARLAPLSETDPFVPAVAAADAKTTTEFEAALPSYSNSDILGLPEYDYPVPFKIAADNTPKLKSSSDGFFQPCAIRSCPNSDFSMAGLSGIVPLDCGGEDSKTQDQKEVSAEVPRQPPVRLPAPAAPVNGSEAAYLSQLVEALRAENKMLRASLHTGTGREECACPDAAAVPVGIDAPLHPAPMVRAPVFLAASLIPPPPVARAAIYDPPQPPREEKDHGATLSAPLQPVQGSPELPSVGSAGHYAGQCKPCVHFWKKGCMNGAECPFCHLCDADEVKRRQSKKASFRKQATLQAARYKGSRQAGPGFTERS